MSTNGRSTAFITTGDAQRRALWLRLFGEEWLPVKAARPRWQAVRGELNETEILAFDLDAARLPAGACERFAHYIAQKTGISYTAAMHQVDGWPLKAAGCTVETAVSSNPMTRPFVFAREQLGGVGAYAAA